MWTEPAPIASGRAAISSGVRAAVVGSARIRVATGLLVAVTTTICGRSAMADDAVVSPSTQPATATPAGRDVWYGWQMLAADLASFATIGLATQVNDGGTSVSIGALGVVGYVAAGPVIHAAHAQNGKIGGSLALRLGLPVVLGLIGAGIGAASFHQNAENDVFGGSGLTAIGGAVVGAGVGMVGASVCDAVFLAHAPETSAPSSHSAGWLPVPSVAITERRQLFSVGWTF
jgi:hypothetical protein